MDDKYIKLSDAKNAIADYIAEQTVSKYGSLEACREARFGVEGAMKELDYIPAADVVPKSEVEKIFEEIENAIDLNLLIIEKMLNTKGSRANGKTILLVKYEVFTEANKFLAELKKKYTEGEK